MVRDTIQLENAVSTISQEYLLEFSFEYGIPESLHPELLGPEESIMEFPECKVGVYTSFSNLQTFVSPFHNFFSTSLAITNSSFTIISDRRSQNIDLFSLISAPNLAKVKTGTRPRAAHKVPLLTATISREDPPLVITERGEEATTKVIPESSPQKEMAVMGLVGNKRRCKRGNKGAKANAPPKVLRKDYAASHPAQSTCGEKSIVPIGLDAGSVFSMSTAQDALAVAKSVSDPDVLSCVKPQCRYTDKSHVTCNAATKVPTGHVAEPRRKEEEVPGAHHARSDSVLVSVPTVSPQGLAILLADDGMHRLRLVVRKCAESIEQRREFANVMSAGIAKGMSEGLAHGIEHGKAGRESDSGEDALEWIRDLRPSTSQFKIPVYPKVRDPRDPWAVKDEMLLEEAIAANVSRAKKKKSVRWFAIPMWSVPPIMLDLTASLYRCLPLLLKVLRSYWRMLLHRQIHPKMMLIQDC
nr:hypothetical protein [Tanacetum cinerariifolium]